MRISNSVFHIPFNESAVIIGSMRQKRSVLYSGSSPHGSYRIIDTTYNGRPARLLYGDGDSPQSGVALDDDPELLFDYNQRFLEMIKSRQPRNILIIGGGGFMLPIAAYRLFPHMIIDVVEIDELLVQLSYEFFNLPDNPRLRVHIGDGAELLTASRERYDMIIIDAFSGYTIPTHLYQHGTIAQYRRHLDKRGIVAINFISGYSRWRRSLAHDMVDNFSSVFTHIAMFQSDPHDTRGRHQNLILTASDSMIHFDYLQSSELELLQTWSHYLQK